jgi:endonuclease/exonuclease/phosphatase family metal-dependent hydrolase
MARKKAKELDALIRWLARWLAANPKRNLPIALGLLAVVLVIWWVHNRATRPSSDLFGAPVPPGEYLFCFWNVENLFDDRDENRPPDDEQYDDWFGRDSEALNHKLQRLTEALLLLNGGRGPDILAAVEVEGYRAADLLRNALNQRLTDPAQHYQAVLMKDLSAGRHIAPAIITRLPVRTSQTRLIGSRMRILEGQVEVNGHGLTIVASHWTSRVTDQTGERREKYAETIYNLYHDRVSRDPAVDFLVCGDFNDPPEEASVTDYLRAVGDRARVLAGGPESSLLNLMAGKDPSRYGTHYHGGKLLLYDQIVISRGLLDEVGWSCDPESVAAVNTLVRPGDRRGAPWRFGNERDNTFERGYSDHFPVIVRLKVR